MVLVEGVALPEIESHRGEPKMMVLRLKKFHCLCHVGVALVHNGSYASSPPPLL